MIQQPRQIVLQLHSERVNYLKNQVEASLKPYRLLVFVTLLGAFLAPQSQVSANTQAGMPLLFPETGHTLAYSFREFFEQQGGLPIFGLPLTEVFVENGLPVQYFERARLEWHAQLPGVEGGHLGRWAALGRERELPFQPQTAQNLKPGFTFFAESSHSVNEVFLRFWQENGGLTTFGYPISAEFTEENSAEAKSYTVQYFERARFEYHPENPGGKRVLLGHLGREYLAKAQIPEWASQPVISAKWAWDDIRPTRVRIPRIGVDTGVVETGFSYKEWDVPRYTAAHYWPVSAFPNTVGNIIISGHVGYKDIIFNHLPEVQIGDEIFVTASDQNWRYLVKEVHTLTPDEIWVMNPTPTETLTLITCVPIGVYSHRLVVRAVPAQE